MSGSQYFRQRNYDNSRQVKKTKKSTYYLAMFQATLIITAHLFRLSQQTKTEYFFFWN